MISKHNFKYILLGFLVCTLISFSSSQVKNDSVKITELKEIITSGKRKDLGIIPYQKLSGKDLENLNSTSVASAIRYFSGLQLKDYGGVGGIKTVNLRGMGSQHVGVFYDGIQLGNAQNGTVDLGKFSLDNLESISLYAGQKSQIFQSAKDFGSAGSIYMVTKIPKFLGTKKTNVRTNYRSGSFALLNPSVIWEQKLTSNVTSSLNIEYINSNGKYKFHHTKDNWDTIAIRQNGYINVVRAEAGLFGKIKEGKWNLKGYFYNSDREIPGAVIKNSYKKYQFGEQWDRNFFVQGSMEKEFTSKYKILVNAKYAYDYMHYKNMQIYKDPIWGDKFSLLIDNTFKQVEFYISTAQQYSLLSFWDISLSADYQYTMLRSDLSNFAYPKRNTELIALATAMHFDKLKFQTSILATFLQDKVENNNIYMSAPNKKEYTPTIFLSYKPFNMADVSIYSYYKRIFRMPTFNDLYYTDMGNSLLKPEYTNQFDIGINYNKNFNNSIFSNIDCTADIYYNEVKDKIIAYPKGQQFRWSMLNLGKVHIRGIDISAQTSFFINDFLINTKFSYTYEDAQNMTTPTLNYKAQIPYIPWNSGSILLGITFKNWNLNYSFIYTGERYSAPSNSINNYVKAWNTHDIFISKEFVFTNLRFRTVAEINNILNRYFDIVANYPMPGRNYRISIKLNI